MHQRVWKRTFAAMAVAASLSCVAVASASAATTTAYLVAEASGIGTTFAVAPDWTIYGLASDERRVWRLRMQDHRPSMLQGTETPHVARGFAMAPDGAFVRSDSLQIWRQLPGAPATVLAGVGQAAASGPWPTADAGPLPALTTPICVGPMVATAAGVFFVDRDAALRQLQGGVITTVAQLGAATGSARCPWGGSRNNGALAAGPDGALYLVRRGPSVSVVWRVPASGGAAEPVYRGVHIEAIGVERDGTLLLSRSQRFTRVRPGSVKSTSITAAPWADAVSVRAIPAPDGGVLAAASASTDGLYYLPPAANAGRTAVAFALDRVRQHAGRLAVPIQVTRPGRVTLSLRRPGGRPTGPPSRSARRTGTAFSVRTDRRISARILRIEARTPDGQRAAQSVTLMVGDVLAIDDARRRLVPDTHEVVCLGLGRPIGARRAGAADCDNDDVPVRPGACRRLEPRRVECDFAYEAGAGWACVRAAERITPRGTIVSREVEASCDRRGRPLPSGRRVPLPGGTVWERNPNVSPS